MLLSEAPVRITLTDKRRSIRAGPWGIPGCFLVTGWSFWLSTPKTCRKNHPPAHQGQDFGPAETAPPQPVSATEVKESMFWVVGMMGWPGGLQDRGVILIKYYRFIYLCILAVLLSAMTFHLVTFQVTQQQVSYSASLCKGLFFPYGFTFRIVTRSNVCECMRNGLKNNQKSSCPTQRVNSSLGNGRNDETLKAAPV